MSDASGVLAVQNLCRSLGGSDGAKEQVILNDISVSVPRGQFVALTGASGSGKSTLLYLLGALDRASSGEVWLDGVELGALDDDDRAELRNEKLGFVFQFHFLLPEFTAVENVAIPMIRRGLPRDEAEGRAHAMLALLGLESLHARKPGQMSGGQQQRVAIARAVANEPTLILADEPTGNLDSANAAQVVAIFRRLAHELGRTVILVTHDLRFAELADRRIALEDGRITEDVTSASAAPDT
jgi:lipoprotein-releasing system ATP-binding protein